MKQTLHLLFLLVAILLQSCAFDRVEEPKYDIYRVEVGTYLNIRATPSKKGTVLGTINNGALVDVIEVNDGWAKVSYHGEEIGYVSSDYLVLVRQAKKTAPSEDVAMEDDELGMDDDSPLITEANAAKKKGSEVKKDEETRQTAATPGSNVYFIGDSLMLASYEKEEIENRLRQATDYTFIVNTVRSVPTGQLFDYAPDLLDDLSKELDSSMNWWQRFKSWFGGDSPSDHIVLISWIKDAGLLQAECNGNSLKYLKMSEPEKYFRLQAGLRKGAPDAIADLGLAIDRAGTEYAGRSWFVRGQINTGNICDYICDSLIVENILPRDSFWHKWVFGWIFAWPLKTANWFFVLTGSYLISMLLLMALVLGLYFWGTHLTFYTRRKYTTQQINQGKAGCLGALPLLFILGNVYLWLSMLSLIVYMIPEMSKIAVMAQSGFSSKLIAVASHEFMTTAVTKNWLVVTMFFLGLVISLCLNEKYALLATLPSYRQKMIFEKNKEEIENAHLYTGQKYNKEDIEKSPTPYTELAFDYMGREKVGETLGPVIPLAFVFSGTLLFYASIFLWTSCLKKIIHLATGILSYRKAGMY